MGSLPSRRPWCAEAHTWFVDRHELTEIFTRLGARDPESLAGSETDEGIPQLARYLFLKGAWDGVVDPDDPSWIDRLIAQTPIDSAAPYAGTAHALRQLLAGGADRASINEVVRGMQAELMFSLCYLLSDPAFVDGNDVVSWALFELDAEGRPGREMSGLHESVLGTDPTGREMRPER